MSVDDNELVAHRWVRIMVDTSAEGVWSKEGGASSVNDLPVALALRHRILAWQRCYDQGEDSWGLFQGDVEALAREGFAIARAVKTALPDWTVVYHDEAASRIASDGSSARYEYEIDG